MLAIVESRDNLKIFTLKEKTWNDIEIFNKKKRKGYPLEKQEEFKACFVICFTSEKRGIKILIPLKNGSVDRPKFKLRAFIESIDMYAYLCVRVAWGRVVQLVSVHECVCTLVHMHGGTAIEHLSGQIDHKRVRLLSDSRNRSKQQ